MASTFFEVAALRDAREGLTETPAPVALEDAVTVAEAAAKAQVTRQAIHYWIREGWVTSHRASSTLLLVDRRSLDSYLATRSA